jgi:hypothetical protein
MDCKDNTIQRNNHHKKATAAEPVQQRLNQSYINYFFKVGEEVAYNTNEDEFLHPRCIVNLIYKKCRCKACENFESRSLVT